MTYEIDTSKLIELNWGATGNERIVQNVSNLIHTWRNEVAYNRTLGIGTDLLDRPLNIASSLYISEVYRIVADHEPRAQVKDVKFVGVDNDGIMQFRVVVEV